MSSQACLLAAVCKFLVSILLHKLAWKWLDMGRQQGDCMTKTALLMVCKMAVSPVGKMAVPPVGKMAVPPVDKMGVPPAGKMAVPPVDMTAVPPVCNPV
jgi:hypothetical protein